MVGIQSKVKTYLVYGALSVVGLTLHDMQVRTVGAISFNINSSSSTPDWVVDGVSEASNLWSSAFTDDVTVNLDIRYEKLDNGVLGYTNTVEQTYDYRDVYRALSNDSRSRNDAIAVQNLSAGNSFDLLINYTDDSPNGSGSSIPYLDNDGGLNNRRIRMPTANAKALNLSTGNGRGGNSRSTDATITFNPSVKWDADRSDGITGNAYDFVGVAAHEIGHALGFVSGTEFIDESSPYSVNGKDFFFPENSFSTVSTLDLFRFSEESVSNGLGVIDWTANNTNKYFSINGGASRNARFSTGLNHGDGESSSHWKAGSNSGLMQPRLNQGRRLDLTDLDLLAFDVIGWDVAKTSAQASSGSFSSAVSDQSAPSSTDEDSGKEVLAEPISSFEMAIATATNDLSEDTTLPNLSRSGLALRSDQTAQVTEIPESRSPLGILLAIAGVGISVVYRRSQRKDAAS